jgi:probable DNA metabolism protein
MHLISLDSETDFDGWRMAARALVLQGVTPSEVNWTVRDRARDLPSQAALPLPAATEGRFSVPAKFIEVARAVILHRDIMRFALLYRLLWRLRSHHDLLDDTADPDVAQASAMASAVHRDEQRMQTSLRFHEIGRERTSRYVAWFKPEHHIVEAVAPVFARRYADMPWSILTPEISAHFDGSLISFASGIGDAEMPSEDRLEESWRLYAANLFPPARLQSRTQPPKRSWQIIAPVVSDVASEAHTEPDAAMRGKSEQAVADIDTLRAEAATCRSCHLWRKATQTVFGEGPKHAPIMVVGEQPGDKEDLAGHPFVGPAGQMLDRAMEEAGIDRRKVYVTNAVKHFKFVARGKIRLHQKPSTDEIRACRPWYERELAAVRPRLVIALGATAAQCVFGKIIPINKTRGHPIDLADGRKALVTVHPSYLLRQPDAEAKSREYHRFVDDLKIAASMIRNAFAA